jgi:hypothetical protein
MPNRGWFTYIATGNDPYDPLNYIYASNFPNICTTNGERICSLLGIYDTETSTHPIISDNLTGYITDAQSAGSPKPSIGKKYVYVRST